MENRRLTEIDLLRFFAALSVVTFHYMFRGYVGDHLTNLFYPHFTGIAQYGFLGVQMFFMISGFVIMMTASKTSARQFLASRITRLYPAFWFCCTATFLVSLYFHDALYHVSVGQYLVNLTMMSDFIHVEPIDDVYWTLFIEVKFYLLMSVVLLLNRIKDIKRLLVLWLIGSYVLSWFTVRYVSMLFFPTYSAYFIAGAFFYFISKEGISKGKVAALLACFLQIVLHIPEQSARFEHLYHVHFSNAIITLSLSSFFVLFYMIATGRLIVSAKPIWLMLGAITYPLYLIHQNIGYILFDNLNRYVNHHILAWGMVIVMVLAAYLIHAYIEKPWSSRLKRIMTARST